MRAAAGKGCAVSRAGAPRESTGRKVPPAVPLAVYFDLRTARPKNPRPAGTSVRPSACDPKAT